MIPEVLPKVCRTTVVYSDLRVSFLEQLESCSEALMAFRVFCVFCVPFGFMIIERFGCSSRRICNRHEEDSDNDLHGTREDRERR